ncbi:MAG: hypothetical protein HOP30_10180 [Cyclobacteriaceae bacterium]|nr:hypothetical protein [Cyclobacteriaceae bacterium]
MIDIKNNFLLRDAQHVAKLDLDTGSEDLYRLRDGRYIVHHKYFNPMSIERLERIEKTVAVDRFHVDGNRFYGVLLFRFRRVFPGALLLVLHAFRSLSFSQVK